MTIESRTVTWTVEHERTIGCGTRSCAACGEPSPRPTDEDIIDFSERHPGHNFMWPGEYWVPPGWGRTDTQGLLCNACIEAVAAALAARKAKR